MVAQGGGGLEEYKSGQAGEFSIDEPGEPKVTLGAVDAPGGFVMNLRTLTLVPKDTE